MNITALFGSSSNPFSQKHLWSQKNATPGFNQIWSHQHQPRNAEHGLGQTVCRFAKFWMLHSKGKQFNIVQQHPGSSCMCYAVPARPVMAEPQVSRRETETWTGEATQGKGLHSRLPAMRAAIESTEILWKTRSRGSSTSCIAGHLSRRKQS